MTRKTVWLKRYHCKTSGTPWGSKSTVKLEVKYEDGEEEVVDINQVEPDNGEFESPKEGDEVCCRVSGARYSATILEIRTPGSATPGTKQV